MKTQFMKYYKEKEKKRLIEMIEAGTACSLLVYKFKHTVPDLKPINTAILQNSKTQKSTETLQFSGYYELNLRETQILV